MIETAKKIATQMRELADNINGLNRERALEIEGRLDVVTGRKHSLGLSDDGSAPVGMELNDSLRRTVRQIANMIEKAADAGRVNERSNEAAAKMLMAMIG